jgi:quinol monooxygenase YgiN
MVERSHLAPFLYYVQVDVDPVKGRKYIEWLSSKHIQEVVKSPGFLWARRTPLDEPAADGWKRYMITYAINSREDFEAYRNGPIFKKFMEEVKEFEGLFRVQRFYGQVDLVFD